MISILEKAKSYLTELRLLRAPMNEMANLYPKKTGLGVVIWFGEVGGQHGPRIKVSNVSGKFDQSNCFVVSVSKTPSILTPRSVKLKQDQVADVLDWVTLNYGLLMELWEIHESGDGDSESVIEKLKKV
jgi:hypothetical protein